LESLAEGERVAWVVAGIGVDVSPPAVPTPGAAYLDGVLEAHPPVAAVAAAVLDGIAETYAVFNARGFGALRGAYDERASLDGLSVEVRDARGEVVAAGVATGVDEAGRLMIDGADGPRAVAAGDVTLRA
jgi:BirA family biotin operon repressor/biotin-[acetyl-CoA-carboxylase] ligase